MITFATRSRSNPTNKEAFAIPIWIECTEFNEILYANGQIKDKTT